MKGELKNIHQFKSNGQTKIFHEKVAKFEDDLKNEDVLKNKDDLKNEDDH